MSKPVDRQASSTAHTEQILDSVQLLLALCEEQSDRLTDVFEKSVVERLDSLERRLERETTADAEVADGSAAAQLETVVRQLEVSMNQQFDQLRSQLVLAPAGAEPIDADKPIAATESDCETQASPDDGQDRTRWEFRKQAMLEAYDEPESPANPSSNSNETDALAAPESDPEVALDEGHTGLEDLQESLDRIADVDNPAVEALKQELNAKLRDAEIEISINRAKLSQERAELERQRSELEQRMTDLEGKLADRDRDRRRKSGGLMSRVSRHLGR